jgi:hypothetical protein
MASSVLFKHGEIHVVHFGMEGHVAPISAAAWNRHDTQIIHRQSLAAYIMLHIFWVSLLYPAQPPTFLLREAQCYCYLERSHVGQI